MGRGRGEVLRPVEARTRLWHVLVTPRLHVLAKDVYGRLNAPAWKAQRPNARPDLPKNSSRAVTVALKKNDYPGLKALIFNSLEAPVLAMHPALQRIQHDLLKAGADAAIVSGSGPTVFGLVRTQREARTLAGRIRKRHPSKQILTAATAL